MRNFTLQDMLETFWIVLIPLAIVVGGFLYQNSDLFFARDEVQSVDTAGRERGARVKEALAVVSGITFSESEFTSPAFRSLVDFTVPIYPEQMGRKNPYTLATATPPKIPVGTSTSPIGSGRPSAAVTAATPTVVTKPAIPPSTPTIKTTSAPVLVTPPPVSTGTTTSAP